MSDFGSNRYLVGPRVPGIEQHSHKFAFLMLVLVFVHLIGCIGLGLVVAAQFQPHGHRRDD